MSQETSDSDILTYQQFQLFYTPHNKLLEPENSIVLGMNNFEEEDAVPIFDEFVYADTKDSRQTFEILVCSMSRDKVAGILCKMNERLLVRGLNTIDEEWVKDIIYYLPEEKFNAIAPKLFVTNKSINDESKVSDTKDVEELYGNLANPNSTTSVNWVSNSVLTEDEDKDSVAEPQSFEEFNVSDPEEDKSELEIVLDDPNKFHALIGVDYAAGMPSFAIRPHAHVQYDRFALSTNLNIPHYSLTCMSGPRFDIAATIFIRNKSQKFDDHFLLKTKMVDSQIDKFSDTYSYGKTYLPMPKKKRSAIGVRTGLLNYTIHYTSEFVKMTTDDGYTIEDLEVVEGDDVIEVSKALVSSNTYKVLYIGAVFETSEWIEIIYKNQNLLNQSRGGFFIDLCGMMNVSRDEATLEGEYYWNDILINDKRVYKIDDVTNEIPIGTRTGMYVYGNFKKCQHLGMDFSISIEVLPGRYAGNMFGLTYGIHYLLY